MTLCSKLHKRPLSAEALSVCLSASHTLGTSPRGNVMKLGHGGHSTYASPLGGGGPEGVGEGSAASAFISLSSCLRIPSYVTLRRKRHKRPLSAKAPCVCLSASHSLGTSPRGNVMKLGHGGHSTYASPLGGGGPAGVGEGSAASAFISLSSCLRIPSYVTLSASHTLGTSPRVGGF